MRLFRKLRSPLLFSLLVLSFVLGCRVVGMRGLRRACHWMGLKGNSRISNRSSRDFWVIVTSDRKAYAYRLEPGRQSPDSLDADAVRSVDGTPIDQTLAWQKVLDGFQAEVSDQGRQLQLDCLLCYPVDEHEFTDIQYRPARGWGSVRRR